jgi:carboxyl-terminal processing protease
MTYARRGFLALTALVLAAAIGACSQRAPIAPTPVPETPSRLTVEDVLEASLLLAYEHVDEPRRDVLLMTAWRASVSFVGGSGVIVDDLPDPILSNLETRGIAFTESFNRLLLQGKDQFSEDALARRAITAMVASVSRSHTAFIPPERWRTIAASGAPDRFMPLFLFRTIETPEGAMVWDVVQGSKADKIGIRKGDVLESINGVSVVDPASARLREATQEVSLTRNGKSLTLAVEIEPETSKPFQARMIDEFAYVYLYTCPDITLTSGKRTFLEEFESNMTDLVKQKPKGWILDLRSNRGAESECLSHLAAAFGITEAYATVSFSDGTAERLSPSGKNFTRGQEVVILVDQYTASGAEIIASTMQQSKIAKVVGTRSSGRVMLSGRFPLPNGGGLQIAVGSVRVGRDNVEVEGHGVLPDVVVPLTRMDVLAGRDTQLEAAVSILKSA